MIKGIFAVAFILIIIPSLVMATTTDYAKINIETAYTEPYPIEPGKNLVLGIQISNSGNDEADDIAVILEPTPPFTLLETARKDIKVLDSGGTRVIEYNLFVDISAVSAVYEIPVNIVFDSSNMTKKLQTRVQGTPQFEISDFKTNEINPGDRKTLSIQIQNVGTGNAKRTTATLTSSSDYITPIFSGGSVYINEFKAGEKEWVKFDILVDQDAEYGVYTGTVTLKYIDEAGANHTKTYDIGILVSGEPRFNVVKSEINSKNNELEVEMINSGTAKGLAIKSELWINDKLFDTDYATQVKIDKKATLKFNLPGKVTSGVVKLYYKGPDNKEYTQEENIAWKSVGRSNTLFVVVGLGVVPYLVWKKPWKKMKWFKKMRK